jgi:hypothetical protein
MRAKSWHNYPTFLKHFVPLLAVTGASLLSFLAAPVTATTPAGSSSVGFYPAKVVFPQALRGGTFTQRVGVIVGGKTPQKFNFSTSGPIAGWLTVLPSSGAATPLKSLVAAPGDTDVGLRLVVPSHAANGTYKGKLVVETPPSKGAKGTSAVGFGAIIDVTAQVTGTQVLSARLLNAYTYPKVEVGSPLPVFSRIHNSGNVVVKPVLHLTVSRGKSIVFRGLAAPGTVQPSSLSTLEMTWPGADTKTQPLGGYHATLVATFGHLHVGTATIKFQLVPYGSLHRGGKLLSLKLLNKPAVGGYAEVRATVKSTGEAAEQTSFVGQLYRNGTLVQPLKSAVPVLLQPAYQPGATAALTLAVPVKKGGAYRLSGFANFGGAQSTTKAVVWKVGSSGTPIVYEIAGGAVAVVLLLVIIGTLATRNRRRRGPPAAHIRTHSAPRYTATRPRSLHVPPKTPVGTSPGRSFRARHN